MVETISKKAYIFKGHVALTKDGERTTHFAGEAVPENVDPGMLAKWIKRNLVITKEEADKIAEAKAAEEKKAKAALKR